MSVSGANLCPSTHTSAKGCLRWRPCRAASRRLPWPVSSRSPRTRSPEAREEIDALNVYPVPDGDTGTNMFLTISAARDAIVQAVAETRDSSRPSRHADPGPRRPARRARQLRRHPEPDARGLRRPAGRGHPRRPQRRRGGRGHAARDRRVLRRRRRAGRGHHPHRGPRCLRRGSGARRRGRRPGPRRLHGRRGSGPRGPGPHAHPAQGPGRRRCRRRRRAWPVRRARRRRDRLHRPTPTAAR